MKKEKKHSGIWGKVSILLGIIIVIIGGGYLLLDKLIVPKYFSEYGIHGMGDLVGVVSSLYKNPKEEQLVTNGFSEADYVSASEKLDESGYNIDDNGDIVIENFKTNAQAVELTDREFAAVCNKLIDKGILTDVLPNLNYINLLNISILEVNLNFDEESKNGNVYSSANINFIAKLATQDLKNQMATQMETPISLLNMIIPSDLYFTVSYDIDLEKEGDERIANGNIAINGRTAEQSQILINMLIDFVFPPEDEMNLHKFTNTFGDIILKSIDKLGDFQFKKVDDRNGLLISPK